jgi:hypothetical protein
MPSSCEEADTRAQQAAALHAFGVLGVYPELRICQEIPPCHPAFVSDYCPPRSERWFASEPHLREVILRNSVCQGWGRQVLPGADAPFLN